MGDRTKAVAMAFALVFASGCNEFGGVATFTLPASPTSGTSVSWATAETIDAGDFIVNNDLSDECASGNANASLLTAASGRGCMQNSPILYSDSRWFVGFNQNYLGFSGGGVVGFSAFVNMTNLVTNLFGTLGFGLGVIDPGNALNNPPTASSRYIRFAKFSNGNVVAIYWTNNSATAAREVYASVYDASLNTWGAATQLSTAAAVTDFGADFLTYTSVFCRPAVATAGTTALASWCEGATSQVRYATYSNGVWTAGGSVLGTNTNFAQPSFSSSSQTFTTMSFTTGINGGDIYSGGITRIIGGANFVDIATVSAVTTTPSVGEFAIATDSSSNILVKSTLENMISALMSKPVNTCDQATATVCTASTRTLSQLGASMQLDSACDDTSATCTVAMYYNKNLNNVLRNISVVTDGYALGVEKDATATGTATMGASTVLQNVTDFTRSSALDVAGDGSGNYALVRTVQSPFFFTSSVTTAGNARALVGHEFSASTGAFKTNTSDTNHTSPLLQYQISQNPACFDGSDYEGCSVRNPKVLMSSSGSGLVLFYQNQLSPIPFSGSDFPTRLWYATYGTASGFSSAANTLDQDTICSSSAVANDTSVCETASYTDTDTFSTARCQNLDEASIQALPISTIDHDIPPIAAAMNASGQAVIAYHKRVNTGTSSAPVCDTVGTFAVTYDTTNGFGNTVQLDNGRDSMHVQVAINSLGEAVAVWEEVSDSDSDGDVDATYLYLKKWSGSSWGSSVLINGDSNLYYPSDSMMPSVGISDTGEILVSFTYGTATTNRRQYVRRYYAH